MEATAQFCRRVVGAADVRVQRDVSERRRPKPPRLGSIRQLKCHALKNALAEQVLRRPGALAEQEGRWGHRAKQPGQRLYARCRWGVVRQQRVDVLEAQERRLEHALPREEGERFVDIGRGSRSQSAGVDAQEAQVMPLANRGDQGPAPGPWASMDVDNEAWRSTACSATDVADELGEAIRY